MVEETVVHSEAQVQLFQGPEIVVKVSEYPHCQRVWENPFRLAVSLVALHYVSDGSFYVDLVFLVVFD